MAGRGTDKGGRKSVRAEAFQASAVPGSTVPKPEIAAVERRKTFPWRRALVFQSVKLRSHTQGASFGAPPPSRFSREQFGPTTHATVFAGSDDAWPAHSDYIRRGEES